MQSQRASSGEEKLPDYVAWDCNNSCLCLPQHTAPCCLWRSDERSAYQDDPASARVETHDHLERLICQGLDRCGGGLFTVYALMIPMVTSSPPNLSINVAVPAGKSDVDVISTESVSPII